MKSRLIGFEMGEYFDDLVDLNLLEVNEPMTKMVFWRYTCPRPCLGTADIPGRNGHITSFLTRYGKLKSKFHGYPLLGGTKTAMRSFFNFTDRNNIHSLLYLLQISDSKFRPVYQFCRHRNTVLWIFCEWLQLDIIGSYPKSRGRHVSSTMGSNFDDEVDYSGWFSNPFFDWPLTTSASLIGWFHYES